MSTTEHKSGRAASETVDEHIRQHFQRARETTDVGEVLAPFSAADKLHLANRCGVDLAIVEQRLQQLCEEVAHTDKFAAVPRYRLRS